MIIKLNNNIVYDKLIVNVIFFSKRYKSIHFFQKCMGCLLKNKKKQENMQQIIKNYKPENYRKLYVYF